LLDLRPFDPGSTLIYVGAYALKILKFQNSKSFKKILGLLTKFRQT